MVNLPHNQLKNHQASECNQYSTSNKTRTTAKEQVDKEDEFFAAFFASTASTPRISVPRTSNIIDLTSEPVRKATRTTQTRPTSTRTTVAHLRKRWNASLLTQANKKGNSTTVLSFNDTKNSKKLGGSNLLVPLTTCLFPPGTNETTNEQTDDNVQIGRGSAGKKRNEQTDNNVRIGRGSAGKKTN